MEEVEARVTWRDLTYWAAYFSIVDQEEANRTVAMMGGTPRKG